MSPIHHHPLIVESIQTPHRGTLRIRGLSMVEMLVALAIGLFLVAGIIQVFAASKASYRFSEAQTRVQESGRYAARLLATELRASRSAGCRSALMEEQFGSLNVLACALRNPDADGAACSGSGDPVIGSRQPLGYDASQEGTSGWLAGLPGDASTGGQKTVASQWLRGDVVVTWGTVGRGAFVKANGSVTANRTGPVDLVEDSDSLKPRGIVLVTDCLQTDVFAITNPKSDPQAALGSLSHGAAFEGATDDASAANLEPSVLSRAYGLTTTNAADQMETRPTDYRPQAFPFVYKVFYICCMDSRDGEIENGGPVANCSTTPDRYRPALCRWSAADGAEQVVADVADMRVTYDGRVSDGPNASSFRDTEASPDAAWVEAQGLWDRVTSARIQLLASSGEQVRNDSDALVGSEDPDDLGYDMTAGGRFYDAFDVTVSIRSSSPWEVR